MSLPQGGFTSRPVTSFDRDDPVQCNASTIVALVDVLGARAFSLAKACHAVDHLGRIVSKAHIVMAGDSAAIAAHLREKLPKPEVRLLGDTIAFIWVVNEDRARDLLNVASLWMQEVFFDALQVDLPLRGAFGYGELAWTAGTALGPAMSDAARWYDKLEWIGVVVGTECERLIEARQAGTSRACEAAYFARYEAPLRVGKQQLWAMSWPYILCTAPVASPPRDRVTRALQRLSLPQEEHRDEHARAKRKQENTVAFFDWFVKQFPCYRDLWTEQRS